jgi:ATP synthase protein I
MSQPPSWPVSSVIHVHKDRPSPIFRALQVSSVGIEMAVAIAIGWGFGFWLDRQLDSGPWLMLVFLLLGVAAGFKGLLRTARSIQAAPARRTGA